MIAEALESLRPLVNGIRPRYSIHGDTYDKIEWLDTETAIPTFQEVTNEIARLEAEYEATEYERLRKREYPAIDELIVALWESIVENNNSSINTLQAKRSAIKTKYPRP